jgi:hypothetical protein
MAHLRKGNEMSKFLTCGLFFASLLVGYAVFPRQSQSERERHQLTSDAEIQKAKDGQKTAQEAKEEAAKAEEAKTEEAKAAKIKAAEAKLVEAKAALKQPVEQPVF